MPGKVYLVGAGPGDPGLFTLRGRELIRRAGCVIYDFLANEELLTEARGDCEKVFAGKRAGRHTIPQDKINNLMIRKAQSGQVVVRLKGGDPFVFGRGGEEAAALAEAHIPFEIVPGVSSAYAVPAYAGIPVTHRDFAAGVSVLSAHPRASAAPGAPSDSETLVFLMGAHSIAEIVGQLLAAGRPGSTPAAVIRWGTTPQQSVTIGTLDDISEKAREVQPPAITIIGEVVRLRERLSWFEKRPLFGQRVVITRMREQAADLRDLLAERGAQPVELATIEMRDPDSWAALDGAIERLGEFNFLLFTSANGVRKFIARLRACGFDARHLHGVEIGAIGPGTAAELEKNGVRADILPEEYRAEGLLEALEGRDLTGKSVLVPRAGEARNLLPQALCERGARVEVIEAYRVVAPHYSPEDLEAALAPPPGVITFTSSSTAKNFAALPFPAALREQLALAKIASIGPITSETLRALGMSVDIEAQESTILGLVEAIEGYFGGAAR